MNLLLLDAPLPTIAAPTFDKLLLKNPYPTQAEQKQASPSSITELALQQKYEHQNLQQQQQQHQYQPIQLQPQFVTAMQPVTPMYVMTPVYPTAVIYPSAPIQPVATMTMSSSFGFQHMSAETPNFNRKF